VSLIVGMIKRGKTLLDNRDGITLKNRAQVVGLFINFLSDTCNSQVIYKEECPGRGSRD
jgi:hypothetical protein